MWPSLFRRALALIVGLLAIATPLAAQEIMQAQVLNLTMLEVQIFVSGAQDDDKVQCLLRDATGRVRVGGTESVSTGLSSGSMTLLSIVLPVLGPDEGEFAVTIVRDERVLSRTEWRPLFRVPAPRKAE